MSVVPVFRYGYEKPWFWSDEQVDELMRDYYGCEQIVVLKPIPNDTTRHIDLFAKLVGPRAILLGEFPEDTRFTEDHQYMEDNLELLSSLKNTSGDPFVVTRVPMLEPYEGSQVPFVYRSYLNSEIVNDYVAMPTYITPMIGEESAVYLEEMEAEAVAAYETANPASKGRVYPINADVIIGYAGAFHCISHEVNAETGGGWEPPSSYCGDMIVSDGEDCERQDLAGKTCESQGKGGGELECGYGCAFSYGKCDYPDAGAEEDPDGGTDGGADLDTDADGDADADEDGDAGADGGELGDDADGCGCRAVGVAGVGTRDVTPLTLALLLLNT